ncbi:hypothetical protein Afil01_60830 [Actinorhabdospora filicis]|uniref:Winged helix DNA-binding domain-containing protein n=1 Tax=Actinorhabdospora filicis TaxID=1785913 RepID=A0A9W6WD57_9ACTN|nr:winged helix DNA-binding domain-containing protein [Actinorhabdospora filicis]GLZ81276.1 hypothetical protein Afil01_60830 [Actinorhabdospora filicis]
MALTDRVLTRATLHRQLLTGRAPMGAVAAIGHLAGLQGQEPNSPYLALWARLRGFSRDELTGALHERSVVRGTLFRGTQHLVTGDDYAWMRPLIGGSLGGRFTRDLAAIGKDELAEAVREILAGRSLTRPQLRDALLERWPGTDRIAMAYAAQFLVALLHPPPSGVWNSGRAVPMVLAEEWLGRPLTTAPVADLVRRYLAAFGPATVKDVQAWSGLTRLSEVLPVMGLRTYAASDGRVLYDLPELDLPDADLPLPVRILPDFDQLMVSFADRRRVMDDDVRAKVCVGAVIAPTILVDGRVAAMWRLSGKRVFEVISLRHLPAGTRADIEAEATALLSFMDVEDGEVRFT